MDSLQFIQGGNPDMKLKSAYSLLGGYEDEIHTNNFRHKGGEAHLACYPSLWMSAVSIIWDMQLKKLGFV